jgi:four helix bundle suffix protein
MAEGFIPKHGGYRSLLSYKKAEIVFDATYNFCKRFVPERNRTSDQMYPFGADGMKPRAAERSDPMYTGLVWQSARSGKQNIAEASRASGTSKETEIKLTGVARSSLEELLIDFQDYLRVRDLELWDKSSPEAQEVRQLGARRDALYADFKHLVERGEPQTSANTIICLIHQANYLLNQQIRSQEAAFVTEGGLRERMARARINERKKPNV